MGITMFDLPFLSFSFFRPRSLFYYYSLIYLSLLVVVADFLLRKFDTNVYTSLVQPLPYSPSEAYSIS
jgi:hypothetical protein